MKFKQKYDYGTHAYTPDQTGIVDAIVSVQHASGELETLRYKLDVLAEIVGYMASLMSDDEIVQLANHFGWERE